MTDAQQGRIFAALDCIHFSTTANTSGLLLISGKDHREESSWFAVARGRKLTNRISPVRPHK